MSKFIHVREYGKSLISISIDTIFSFYPVGHEHKGCIIKFKEENNYPIIVAESYAEVREMIDGKNET